MPFLLIGLWIGFPHTHANMNPKLSTRTHLVGYVRNALFDFLLHVAQSTLNVDYHYMLRSDYLQCLLYLAFSTKIVDR